MKLKHLHNVSFWFGIIYLIFKLLSIPGLIMLYKAQGVSLSSLLYVISTNSLISNLTLFGSLISGILIGILIISIYFLINKNKINSNKLIDTATVMFSITTLVIVLITTISIFAIISTQSIQTLLTITSQLSKITYPVFPIFFLISIILLVVGYMKEKLKTKSPNNLGIILSSLALLIIIFLDLVKILH